MNGRIQIGLLAVAMIVALSLFDSYGNSAAGSITGAAVAENTLSIVIDSGWNAIGATALRNIISKTCSQEQIRHLAYNPYNPAQGDSGIYALDRNLKLTDARIGDAKAVWLLNRGDSCSITARLKTLPAKLSGGWNMVAVPPGWQGREVSELLGDCDLMRAYLFSPSSGWRFAQLDTKFSSTDVGKGLFINVVWPCELSVKAAPAPAPAKPPCTDSDDDGKNSGKDIFVKGTASTPDVSRTDTCSSDSTSIAEYFCNSEVAGGIAGYFTECLSTHTCKDGACVEKPAAALECTDSDSGNYPFTKGTVSIGDKTVSDSCISSAYEKVDESDAIMEYSCSDDKRSYSGNNYACPGGCKDGACKKAEQTAAQKTVAQTCKDSDGGNDPYLQGTLDYGTVEYDAVGDRVSETDACDSPTKVIELYCDEKGGRVLASVDCSSTHGCKDGACVEKASLQASQECADSDDGQNFFAKGTVSFGDVTKNDYCMPNTRTVVEYYCVGRDEKDDPDEENSVYSSVRFRCSYGCKDGACAKKPKPKTGVDLDVTYIRRTPEYPWNAQKNWPDVGEKVTFTAHIINKGTEAASNVGYKWRIYDAANSLLLEKSGSLAKLGAGDEATAQIEWNWLDGPNRLVFTVDPSNTVKELHENNNELDEYTNAYLVAFRVEKTVYDWFNLMEGCDGAQTDIFVWADGSTKPGYRCGTKSWEDWAQRQVKQLNEFFAKAENDYFNGARHSLPRARLQRVDVVTDDFINSIGGSGNCPFASSASDPDNAGRSLYDLTWGFARTEREQTGQPQLIDFIYANPNKLAVERPLLHELGHELMLTHNRNGIIFGEKMQIKDSSGNPAFQQEGTAYSCDKNLCDYDGVMTNPEGGTKFSMYDSFNMKYALGYLGTPRALPTRTGARNMCVSVGYTSKQLKPIQLWDNLQIPASNKLKVVDVNDKPIRSADVSIYQAEGWYPYWKPTAIVDNVPDFVGKTDSQSVFDLGSQPLALSNSYYNGGRTLVIKISQGGYVEYRFLDSMQMNMEFWKGNNKAVYPTVVTAQGTHKGIANLAGKKADMKNIAINKPTSDSIAVAGGKKSARISTGKEYANDGDKTDAAKAWQPGGSGGKVGDWWQVDLGKAYDIYKVTIHSFAGNYNDWYSKFRIEASEDGNDWKTVAKETNWQSSTDGGQSVDYPFNPTPAMYVRIVSETDQDYVRLQEVEVYRVTG